MRVLVTGAAGMLGRDVVAAATAAGHDPIPLDKVDFDIVDDVATDRVVARIKPDVLINCAAYTDVDRAEREPDAADAVNLVGARNLAAAAAAHGAWILHMSTDYVFDGSKRTPYVESDVPHPLSVYGASKLAGEEAVSRDAATGHTIVRTAWLFGARGRCFPETILRLAGQQDELRVVADQVGSPTFTGHLAQALVELAEPDRRLHGIVHLTAEGECSWHEFAAEVLAQAGIAAAVTPVSTAEFPRPATRPAYSVMRTERTEPVPMLPHWREGLREYLSTQVTAR